MAAADITHISPFRSIRFLSRSSNAATQKERNDACERPMKKSSRVATAMVQPTDGIAAIATQHADTLP